MWVIWLETSPKNLNFRHCRSCSSKTNRSSTTKFLWRKELWWPKPMWLLLARMLTCRFPAQVPAKDAVPLVAVRQNVWIQATSTSTVSTPRLMSVMIRIIIHIYQRGDVVSFDAGMGIIFGLWKLKIVFNLYPHWFYAILFFRATLISALCEGNLNVSMWVVSMVRGVLSYFIQVKLSL